MENRITVKKLINNSYYFINVLTDNKNKITDNDILKFLSENCKGVKTERYINQFDYVNDRIILYYDENIIRTGEIRLEFDYSQYIDFFNNLKIVPDDRAKFKVDEKHFTKNTVYQILDKFMEHKKKYDIGDTFVYQDEIHFVKNIIKIIDIQDNFYVFNDYTRHDENEIDTYFYNVKDLLWFFEMKVKTFYDKIEYIKNNDALNLNNRMTIDEADEYVGKEIEHYTVLEAMPLYSLGFRTK